MSHLKVFGSVAYAHVPSQQRTKLEDKCKKYVFIGYDEMTKAYKLLDPINQKVIVSRDVRVDEANEWSWNNSIEEMSGDTSSSISIPPATENFETTDDEDEPRRPRIRTIQELYESTEQVHVVCLLVGSENITFEEAVQDENWRLAMAEEIDAIERNNTWELSNLPTSARAIGVKWVYKKKMNAQGEIERYKA